jgi:hypothetical protein
MLSSAIILLLSSFPTSLHAQGHSELKVDPDARNEWVKQVRNSLKGITPDDVPKKVKLKAYERDGMIRQKYRINKAGLIQFNSKEWVYVTLHSQHDDDRIGDLAIAIDQDGKYYYHLGHVCGGIVHYQATATNLFSSSEDFFLYFKDDIDGLPWHRLKRSPIPVSPLEHD